ncbi:MAG: BON domain-containing protein [Pseudomonadota bacterium]
MKIISFTVICLALTSFASHAAENAVSNTVPPVENSHADNTNVNKRDQNNQTLTPMDQSNSKSDLQITGAIRKSLIRQHLSMDAKNIKIITINGDVTLRGPVSSRTEIDKVVEITKSIPGIKKLNNQLEVK